MLRWIVETTAEIAFLSLFIAMIAAWALGISIGA